MPEKKEAARSYTETFRKRYAPITVIATANPGNHHDTDERVDLRGPGQAVPNSLYPIRERVKQMSDEIIVVSTPYLPGHKITKTLGFTWGLIVRSRGARTSDAPQASARLPVARSMNIPSSSTSRGKVSTGSKSTRRRWEQMRSSGSRSIRQDRRGHDRSTCLRNRGGGRAGDGSGKPGPARIRGEKTRI